MKVDVKMWWAIPALFVILLGISMLIPAVRNGVVEVLVNSVHDSKAMVAGSEQQVSAEVQDVGSDVSTDTDSVTPVTSVNNVSTVGTEFVAPVKKDNMEIHVLNSSGTAILVVSGGEGLLLDGSDGTDGKKIVDYIRAQGIFDLRYLVATNYHEKSLSGVSKILSYISSDYILMSQNVANDKLGTKLRSYLDSKQLTWNIPSKRSNFVLGDITFELLPTHDGGSLVTVITNDQSKYVVTGDITRVDKDLIAQLPNSVETYFVSSRMPSYVVPTNVLAKLNPKNIVMGANPKGEANTRTLGDLKESGATVYNTSEGGSVIIKSNGVATKYNSKKF